MRVISFIVIFCITSSLIISCNAHETMTDKERAEQAIIAFLELCRKGNFDEACESYLAEDLPKPTVLRDRFEYRIVDVFGDNYSETRYGVLARLQQDDGTILSMVFRYDAEENRIDFFDVRIIEPGGS